MDYYPIAPSAWETDVPKFFEFECNQLPKLRAKSRKPFLISSCNSPWAANTVRDPCSKGLCTQCDNICTPWAHTAATAYLRKQCCTQ